jgi:WD40 repeat protein
MTLILERVITEHARAVNRISCAPAASSLLVSASQDGTMRIWVRVFFSYRVIYLVNNYIIGLERSKKGKIHIRWKIRECT